MAIYQKNKIPIVYLDESGFSNDMPRTHGYSRKGVKCYGKQDWGAKGRTNAIGALLGMTLLTVSLFEHNIDANTFNSWIEQDLIPKLPEHSIVVMDNAAFHKSKDMKEKIKNAGHVIEYLPTYSPDLNPIEHKWAQAKNIRKKNNCNIDEIFTKYLA